MVKIRLRKVGMRHQPSYRIVAVESHRPRGGEYLELLGHYEPRRKSLKMDIERVQYWLARGAQPTDVTRKLIKRYAKEHPAPEEAEGTAGPQPETASESSEAVPAPEATDTKTTAQSNAP